MTGEPAAAWARALAAGDHARELGPDLLAAVDAMGAAAEDSPLVEAAVAAWVLTAAGAPAPDVATTVALAGEVGAGPALTVDLRAVPWARGAARLVVVPAAGEALLVELGPGARIEPGANVAEEPRDRVRLDAAPATALTGAPPRDEIVARLALLRAAALAGAARATLDMTRAHVRTREQFGAPLIELPAVAANLAVMRTELIQGQAGLARAVAAFAPGRMVGERLDAVAVARVAGATAATTIARLAHQLHGARGVTGEHPLHRLTRRLWAWRDGETPEREWARHLGRRALAGGETLLWEELTSADPA